MPILIIAEKPNAAQKIAAALGRAKKSKGRAYYLEVDVDGECAYVVPSVGHIFSLKQKGKGWTYPTFDVEWVPSFKADKGAKFTEAYYKNLEKIAKKCDRFVIATDYDAEGSVIGYNILRFICGKDDAQRMKFSTLTADELRESFENAGPLDRPQIEAGLARHILDWLFGVNITRALTKAVNYNQKGFSVLSTGRVQGPTLKLLAERERTITAFKKEPFWQIAATLNPDEPFTALYEKDRIWDEPEARRIADSCGSEAIVESIDRGEYTQEPPFPFDLTTLQTESYSAFGLSPTQTLEIAQSLYEAGLISYPRTASQKLPEKIGYLQIIKELEAQKKYAPLVRMLPARPKPNEGPKSDPAHPAIFPTGAVPSSVSKAETAVYDLIVRRFLATFGKAAMRESVDVMFDLNGNRFRTSGHRTIEKNWIAIYEPYARFKEELLPELKAKQRLDVSAVEVLAKETQPPKRYTEASLVRELERRNLGTKATRASIIKTLYDREYIRNKSIEITELGLRVIEVLEKHCPEILSEELTRDFENEMEAIMEGRSNKEKVIVEAQETLTRVLTKFKESEEAVGAELAASLKAVNEKKYIVGKCSSCGSNLRIIVSKSSGKRFIGCEGYSKGCKTAYPLPQFGLAKPTEKLCETCKAPIVLIIQARRRPWILCINPSCPSKTVS